MDRSIKDWGLTQRLGRYYMRIVFWLVDAAIHNMFILATYNAVTYGEEVWKRYLPEKSRPLYHFQLDLAQALAEAAIELDWPAGGRSDMNKPSWMRQKPCVPCGCGTRFFCKKTMTTGVMTRPTSAAGVYAAKQHTWTTVSKNPCWVCIHVDNCKKNQAQATKATAAAVAGEFLVAFKGSALASCVIWMGDHYFAKHTGRSTTENSDTRTTLTSRLLMRPREKLSVAGRRQLASVTSVTTALAARRSSVFLLH